MFAIFLFLELVRLKKYFIYRNAAILGKNKLKEERGQRTENRGFYISEGGFKGKAPAVVMIGRDCGSAAMAYRHSVKNTGVVGRKDRIADS